MEVERHAEILRQKDSDRETERDNKKETRGGIQTTERERGTEQQGATGSDHSSIDEEKERTKTSTFSSSPNPSHAFIHGPFTFFLTPTFIRHSPLFSLPYQLATYLFPHAPVDWPLAFLPHSLNNWPLVFFLARYLLATYLFPPARNNWPLPYVPRASIN